MRTPDLDAYVEGVLSGNRTLLARAITLVESRRPDHQHMAQEMLTRLLPYAGNAHRVGLSGVPGVGKSTFIEAMGCKLTAKGHKVAVLAIDPSSSRTGGSILGDKTRMERLSSDPNAFIRPSPSGGRLGGVARATRESMVVCEAAGFDVILVETVGTGQNETVVADMVDFFLVLMLPGAGDELQGIKKGILELADMIAVNKADGENHTAAQLAATQYRAALSIVAPQHPDWEPPVVTCAGLSGEGLDILWERICDYRRIMTVNGGLAERRRSQLVHWMWSMVEDRIKDAVHEKAEVRALLPELQAELDKGQTTATLAATRILEAFGLGVGPT
ncbi:methylmalonyl Co-A mutase-associated GTPase MeaB [Phaeovibrio sulfidiphilus]|uniref:Methylmalonyl Co-A mutase-associated GTPase MeaB n=1 Tax=Phaeovibrio sulfidiphilus TaxID=1220600 RepID=A0A8J6YIS8_9PROT|nr:methylmalonyl Co-A mutase-associated GTPase MeaB [Phaeovibrio sulfidiphilus]MBE1237041.1 methylmalonyl Co-A mutase-associated GTPase MeaB [Phaeovibrio sulfidiphilus]